MSRIQCPCSPGAQGVTPVASVRAISSARCAPVTSSARPRTSTLHPERVRWSISSTSKATFAWSAAVSFVPAPIRITITSRSSA
jgi:hypothetical protein